MGFWGWHEFGRGPMLWGGLLMFLFFAAVTALVIWLVVRLVRSTSGRPAAGSPPAVPPVDPVLETLRRRLAEGAITVQEFDELRQKLGV